MCCIHSTRSVRYRSHIRPRSAGRPGPVEGLLWPAQNYLLCRVQRWRTRGSWKLGGFLVSWTRLDGRFLSFIIISVYRECGTRSDPTARSPRPSSIVGALLRCQWHMSFVQTGLPIVVWFRSISDFLDSRALEYYVYCIWMVNWWIMHTTLHLRKIQCRLCVCLCWGAVCTLHFIVTRSFRSIYDFFLSHLLTIECSKWFIWSETVLESIVGIRFCCRWHMSFVHTVAIQTVVFWLDLRFSCFMMFWILWKQLSMRLLVKYIKGGWIQEGSTVGACPSNLQYSSEGPLFWLCVPSSYYFLSLYDLYRCMTCPNRIHTLSMFARDESV